MDPLSVRKQLRTSVDTDPMCKATGAGNADQTWKRWCGFIETLQVWISRHSPVQFKDPASQGSEYLTFGIYASRYFPILT